MQHSIAQKLEWILSRAAADQRAGSQSNPATVMMTAAVKINA